MSPSRDMPTWTKSPEALQAAFAAALDDFPDAERRKMFGYPAAFANGKMWTGLHQQNWVVRLPEGDRQELLAIEGVRPFEPMPGRPMTGFYLLPAGILDDRDALRGWLGRAYAHGLTIEQKPTKAAKPTAPKPAR